MGDLNFLKGCKIVKEDSFGRLGAQNGRGYIDMKVPMRRDLMGVRIDSTSMDGVLDVVSGLISAKKSNNGNGHRCMLIVTAYSESILRARKDPRFRQALEKAELVLADGVSLVAALKFAEKPASRLPVIGWAIDALRGLKIGWEIFTGQFSGQTVTGVDLMLKLIKEAGKKGWRVMLVGGWGSAPKLAQKLKVESGKLKIKAIGGPKDIEIVLEQEENELVDQINTFAPELLFVSFGHFRQEIWLAKNMHRLRAGVAMGVGSAFDELAGVGGWRPVPDWVEKSGLKWLWRVFNHPRHITRAISAAIIYPWRVFWHYRAEN